MGDLLTHVKTANSAPLEAYCHALGWDPSRLRSALHSSGMPHSDLYLSSPNEETINLVVKFLMTEFGFLTITGPNGFGKTALKNFIVRELKSDKEYLTLEVNNPGLFNPLQLATKIAQHACPDSKHPRSVGALFTVLERELVAQREAGVTTVVWIDEGQRLKIGHIELLRALSDIKTAAGESACKIIISGTDDLKKHVDLWLETDPEEAGAFCDRWGFFTIDLKPWSASHTKEWTDRLAKFATGSEPWLNPFDSEAIAAICTNNEGRPRPIIQTVKAALERQSILHMANPANTRITAAVIMELVA
jgi:type II secretory pathway predicted ATPase ExeA